MTNAMDEKGQPEGFEEMMKREVAADESLTAAIAKFNEVAEAVGVKKPAADPPGAKVIRECKHARINVDRMETHGFIIDNEAKQFFVKDHRGSGLDVHIHDMHHVGIPIGIAHIRINGMSFAIGFEDLIALINKLGALVGEENRRRQQNGER